MALVLGTGTIHKTSGEHYKRSKRLSSTWVVYFFVTCIQCSSSLMCMGTDMTVKTFPEGDINVRYGEPLELFCSTDAATSKDLVFKLGQKVLESEIVNETTIRLFIQRPPIQKLHYYCTNNADQHHCMNQVLVGTPPQAVTDFKCVSNNLESLNCTWTACNSTSNLEYLLTFYINGGTLTDCVAQRVSNTSPVRYCLWSIDTRPQYRQALDEYNFRLTSLNLFGNITQNFTVDHFAIVKPERPLNLKVVKNKIGPHSVTLQWSIPSSLSFLSCGLDHKIEYQIAKVDGPNQFRTVETSSLPVKNETYHFELTNLPYAYMLYEVRVYIKSKKSQDLWSNYSFVPFQTKSERPHFPPAVPAGAIHVLSYIHSRSIYVYWKQMEEYEQCGTNFTYLVHIKQQNRTIKPDENKSMSYVLLDKTGLDSLDLYIQSSNDKGTSKNSSYLYIPKMSEMLEGPTSFTKLAYSNGTYELSWDSKFNFTDKFDNYTLFWCRYNWTRICVGKINFINLNSTINNHVIHLPNDQRYEFAISANRGYRTSGMIWANCDISKDAANYDIPVRLDHGSPINTSVNISWILECKLRDGIINGYNITYCPTKNTSNFCDDNIANKSVLITNPDNNSVLINDLLYHRTYRFDFILITANGPIAIKDATTSLTSPEGTPSNPTDITISDIKYNSLNLSYNPPKHKNGNIVMYRIYNYGKQIYTDTVNLPDDIGRRSIVLTGLDSYTNYSLSVQACNKYCSKLIDSETMNIRTTIGPPSKICANATYISENHNYLIKWDPPVETSDIRHKYEILRFNDGKQVDRILTSDNSLLVNTCEGVNSVTDYRVRAINYADDVYHGAKNYGNGNVSLINWTLPGEPYYGIWSDDIKLFCKESNSNNVLVTIIVVTGLFFFGMGYGSVKFYKWYSFKKDIKPQLPDGLDPAHDTANNKGKPSNKRSLQKKEAPCEEKSLLESTKSIACTPEIAQKVSKEKDDNSAKSDHTDTTALSDMTRALDKEDLSEAESTSSIVASEMSLKLNDQVDIQDEIPILPKSNLVYVPLSNMTFIRNNHSNYVTMSEPEPNINGHHPSLGSTEPSTTSYVMASIEPPKTIYTNNMFHKPLKPNPTFSCGDSQPRSYLPTSTLFIPENLPKATQVPFHPMTDVNSLQLQNLSTLRSREPTTKPVTSNGYVQPDTMFPKHQSFNYNDDYSTVLDPSALAEASGCNLHLDLPESNLNHLHTESTTTSPKN